jgi:hypothetical protein
MFLEKLYKYMLDPPRVQKDLQEIVFLQKIEQK